MWWHTRRKQISSFRDTDKSIYISGGRHFSRLLTAEVCSSAVVTLDTTCSEIVWRVQVTHSIRQFPLHFPSRTSPCAITFQLYSTYVGSTHTTVESGLDWWRHGTNSIPWSIRDPKPCMPLALLQLSATILELIWGTGVRLPQAWYGLWLQSVGVAATLFWRTWRYWEISDLSRCSSSIMIRYLLTHSLPVI